MTHWHQNFVPLDNDSQWRDANESLASHLCADRQWLIGTPTLCWYTMTHWHYNFVPIDTNARLYVHYVVSWISDIPIDHCFAMLYCRLSIKSMAPYDRQGGALKRDPAVLNIGPSLCLDIMYKQAQNICESMNQNWFCNWSLKFRDLLDYDTKGVESGVKRAWTDWKLRLFKQIWKYIQLGLDIVMVKMGRRRHHRTQFPRRVVADRNLGEGERRGISERYMN